MDEEWPDYLLEFLNTSDTIDEGMGGGQPGEGGYEDPFHGTWFEGYDLTGTEFEGMSPAEIEAGLTSGDLNADWMNEVYAPETSNDTSWLERLAGALPTSIKTLLNGSGTGSGTGTGASGGSWSSILQDILGVGTPLAGIASLYDKQPAQIQTQSTTAPDWWTSAAAGMLGDIKNLKAPENFLEEEGALWRDISPELLAKYTNPFTKSVTDYALGDMENAHLRDLNSFRSKNLSGWGGSRLALEEGLKQKNYLDSVGKFSAGANLQAYNDAQKMFGSDRDTTWADAQQRYQGQFDPVKTMIAGLSATKLPTQTSTTVQDQGGDWNKLYTAALMLGKAGAPSTPTTATTPR